jgi:hypothetical protein
MIDDEFTR